MRKKYPLFFVFHMATPFPMLIQAMPHANMALFRYAEAASPNMCPC